MRKFSFEKFPPEDQLVRLANPRPYFSVAPRCSEILYRVESFLDEKSIGTSENIEGVYARGVDIKPGRHVFTMQITEEVPKTGILGYIIPPSLRRNTTFQWEIYVLEPDCLRESDFDRAKEIAEDIATAAFYGGAAAKAIEMLQDYYHSLPSDKQTELKEQTRIDEFLDEE